MRAPQGLGQQRAQRRPQHVSSRAGKLWLSQHWLYIRLFAEGLGTWITTNLYFIQPKEAAGAHPCAFASSARSGGHSASAAAPSSAGDAGGRRALAGTPEGLHDAASAPTPSSGGAPMRSRANASVDTATQHCTPLLPSRPAGHEGVSTLLRRRFHQQGAPIGSPTHFFEDTATQL